MDRAALSSSYLSRYEIKAGLRSESAAYLDPSKVSRVQWCCGPHSCGCKKFAPKELEEGSTYIETSPRRYGGKVLHLP